MPQRSRQPGLLTARLGVTTVAVTAAVISFSHVQHLARSAGEPELTAWLLPLSIDGAIAAAAAVVLADSKARRRPTALTWLMLALGLTASLAANIASAQPTWTARAVAAWPPIALALGIEVLASLSRRSTTAATAAVVDRQAGPVVEPLAAPEPSTPRTVPVQHKEALHLVDRAAEGPAGSSGHDLRSDDAAAIETIRELDQAAPDGKASRRTIQDQLGCGASRATRLAALARAAADNAQPDRQTA